MSFVKAATAWPSNAAMIADCARLGYLQRELVTLDPTFGRGMWWRQWRPDELVTHDLRRDGVDFRCLPELDDSMAQAVFDPPYMAPGGRKTSTIADFNDRFGTQTTPRKPVDNQDLIDAGVTELARVLQHRAILLVKCMDYVNGGRLWLGTHWTLTHALASGFRLVDRLEHLSGGGPQSQTTQEHARRNLSTLFVLRRWRKPDRSPREEGRTAWQADASPCSERAA